MVFFADVVRLNLDKLDNLKKAKVVLRTKVQRRVKQVFQINSFVI